MMKKILDNPILYVTIKAEQMFATHKRRIIWDEEICRDVTICVVPSHHAGMKNESDVAELARRLAQDGRIDDETSMMDFLMKVKESDPRHYEQLTILALQFLPGYFGILMKI